MTIRLLAIIAALTAPLAAYELFVPDRQYRFCTPEQPHCPSMEIIAGLDPPKANIPGKDRRPLPMVEDQDGYELAYIEYKDSGERWDNVELEAAKVMIEEARRKSLAGVRDGGPVHLIAFFHGWANNADESDDPVNNKRDVERFRAYLKDYVLQLKSPHAPVVGLFFAWHGRSLNLNHGLHFPSFWTRSAAARRVGLSDDLRGDFHCLTELAIRRGDGSGPRPAACESKTYPQGIEGTPNSRVPRSRVIVLAHSFGARVLENALLGSVPSCGDVEGTCKTLVNAQAARPPVDLIVFENAATGARLIWRQYLSCQPCGDRKRGCRDVAAQAPFDFSKSVMVRSFATSPARSPASVVSIPRILSASLTRC